MEKKAIKEVVVKAEQDLSAAVGNVTYWRVRVGPRGGDVIFKITGLNFATPTPFLPYFRVDKVRI